MKKWASILLVLILAVVCLTGCGKDDSDTKTSRKKETAQSTQKTEPAKDEQQAESAQSEQKTEALPSGTTAKGDIITFGRYEQDNNLDNGPEPIEWIILDYDEATHRALLLSRYGLEAKPYNTEEVGTTWEKCTLRSWLNDEFLNAAFSTEEQSAILVTDVDNSDGQCYNGWGTSGGNNTQDRVFLLSYAEANKYLDVTHENSNNIKSRVAPTEYAIKTGAWTSDREQTADGKPAGWWWLRSPGYYQSRAAEVDICGSFSNSGVYFDYGVIRPTFWLNLESGIF